MVQQEESIPAEDLSGDGGVTKQILVEGKGDFPNQGDTIEAHYIGALPRLKT